MNLEILKQIRGIGDGRINQLIQAGYDSLGKLRSASLDELRQSTKIPLKLLQDIKHLLRRLELRQKIRSKWNPEFKRQDFHKKPSLGDSWRKPKGKHSGLRHHVRAKGAWVQVGYRTPKQIRGLHPSGFRQVIIQNPDQLQGLNPILDAAQIASSVGKRKREQILERAKQLGIYVLNA